MAQLHGGVLGSTHPLDRLALENPYMTASPLKVHDVADQDMQDRCQDGGVPTCCRRWERSWQQRFKFNSAIAGESCFEYSPAALCAEVVRHEAVLAKSAADVDPDCILRTDP